MPSEVKEYSTKRLSDDLAALLDLLGINKAVLIGHDWGAFVVSRFALWHPDRLQALIMLSVPYYPPSPVYIPLEGMVEHVKNFTYQLYFADEKSTAEFERNLSIALPVIYSESKGWLKMMSEEGEMRRLVLGGTNDVQTKCLLEDKELQYYESQFKRGMVGPLSYYRTTKVRFEEEQAAQLPSNLSPGLPVLLLYGTEDPTCLEAQIPTSHELIPRLQVERLEGVGHWLTIEAKDLVASKVLEWLNQVLKVEEKL